ncbi:hypothetical protein ACHWQZ_G018945 [Mnemiopsis leidyi]
MSLKRRIKQFVKMTIIRFFRRSSSAAFSISDASSETLDVDVLIRELSIEKVSLDLPETLYFHNTLNKDKNVEEETMIGTLTSRTSDSSFRPVYTEEKCLELKQTSKSYSQTFY